MNQDETRNLQDQLDRIERCLTGDSNYGQPGLVERVNDHQKRISILERIGVYVAGGGAVIGGLWAIWTQWPRK